MEERRLSNIVERILCRTANAKHNEAHSKTKIFRGAQIKLISI